LSLQVDAVEIVASSSPLRKSPLSDLAGKQTTVLQDGATPPIGAGSSVVPLVKPTVSVKPSLELPSDSRAPTSSAQTPMGGVPPLPMNANMPSMPEQTWAPDVKPAALRPHQDFSTGGGRLDNFVDMLPKITVMGVGGGGCNALNNMIESGVSGVDFVAVNTDAQSLAASLATNMVQLGEDGLGAGARPDQGRALATEMMPELWSHLKDTHLLFLTAGMGGGTGTGATPAIARAAREAGILTIGVVSLPWSFEGAARMRQAREGIQELEGLVDTLITIPNQNLMKLDKTMSMESALKMSDSVLKTGVQGVTDLIVHPGLINLDFADLCTVTSGKGRAIMGTGEAFGGERAREAAHMALSNPLLGDVKLHDASGVLISITGGDDMTLFEVDEVANVIRDSVHPDATIIFGAANSTEMDGGLRVSVIITGLNRENFEADHSARTQTGTGKKGKKVQAEVVEEEAAGKGLMAFFKKHW